MTFAFNKRNLEAIIPTDKRVQYRDAGSRDSVSGLVAEVLPTGKKIFRFRRKLNGKNYNIKIGEFPTLSIENARKMAKELSFAIEQGQDPNSDKRAKRDSLSINDVFELYEESFELDIARGKRRASSLKGYESLYRLHIKPRIGAKKVANLSRHAFKQLLSRLLRDKGYSIHNHVLTMLKSMYKRADLDVSVFAGLTKVDESQFCRKRVLTVDELERLYSSLAQEEVIYQDCVLVLLLTAQRKSTVLSMKWRDIDIENQCWYVDGKNAKNKKNTTVPLAKPVVEILNRRSQSAKPGEEYVFPSTRSRSGHITDKSGKGGFWHRITSRIGLYCPGNDDVHLTIHDLRRTLATYQIRSGGTLQSTSRLLGHSNLAITAKVYAHLDINHIRADLDKTVDKIINPTAPSVSDPIEEAKRALQHLTPEQRALVIASLLK